MNMNIEKLSLKSPSHKYYLIQVLRLIAAFMVIILHSTFYTSERLEIGVPIYHHGANGVKLFFAISGFVMIVSSENLKENIGAWKDFAIKRIIRIVPIYWIVTSYKLIILIFASSLIYHATFDPYYILKSYFFIPAINAEGSNSPLLGVGWTLNFEMFFYLLFTIALALRWNTIVFLSMIFIPLSVLSTYKKDHWPAISLYADPILLDFLYGMIAAKLILKGKKLIPIIAVPIIILSLMYLFLPGMEPILGIYYSNYIITGIAAFLVVYGAASIENLYGHKMPAWLIYLGGASYSLYLIHPIIAPLSPTLLKLLHLKLPLLSVLISIVIAIIGGTIFYKFCEKPLTQFLSKRANRKLI